MVFWTLIIGLGIAYAIQFLLTMLQIKNFNKHFVVLRRMGRVAIGKKKGGLKAGSIAMFAIDEDGIILRGLYLSGVTVLARFKEINDFNGIDIATIEENHVSKYPKQVQKAILDASYNYVTITSGGDIEDNPQTPIQKVTGSIKNVIAQD